MDYCFTTASETAPFWETYLNSNPWTTAPPYSLLDGFSLAQIVPDLLHVVNLGVGRDICGSILKTIIQENHVFQGATIEEKLGNATMLLRDFARQHQLPLRLAKLSKNKLNWKPNRYAELKTGSGYDIGVVARWLESLLATYNHIYGDFCALLWSLNGALHILYTESDGWFLSEEQQSRVRTLGSICLRMFYKLANQSLERNEYLWRCRPKLHLLAHLFKCHRTVNCARCSTWMDEDFLKHISKTLKLVASTTAQKRILERWLLAMPQHLSRAMDP